MKKYIALLLICSLLLLFSACSSSKTTNKEDPSQQVSGSNVPTASLPTGNALITLNDDNTDVGSSGATFENNVLSINKAGSYTLTGKLNGCVSVKVDKTEQVELILSGVTIENTEGPAIYCDSADKMFITVAEGTENTLRDGKNYKDPDGPNATLYCDDDLTVRGTGSLKVVALYKNGISSKNDIKISDLKLTVEAFNTAIRGKYSVTIANATIDINCGKDGIKSTEIDREDKGFVSIESGKLKITAGDDAIQAETYITVLEGTEITANAVGKKTNAPIENIPDGIFK